MFSYSSSSTEKILYFNWVPPMLGRFILKVFAVDFEFMQFLGKALFKISFNSSNLSSVSEKRFHLTVPTSALF